MVGLAGPVPGVPGAVWQRLFAILNFFPLADKKKNPLSGKILFLCGGATGKKEEYRRSSAGLENLL
jgi:hypothetical protein